MASGDNGWRVPTPHQLLTWAFVFVEAAREAAIYPPSSGPGRVLALLAVAIAVTGVNAAERHLSPRVRALLDRSDEKR